MPSHNKPRLAISAAICFFAITAPGFATDRSGPFEIIKSFPVSEPTWGAKWNDLYLVAAQRSVLVFEKTGPGASDYKQTGKLYPGHNSNIKNCQIVDGIIYFGAKAEGLVAYRLEEATKPNPEPILRFTPPNGEFAGWATVAQDRVYLCLNNGGLVVLDRKTFEILGEGLGETRLSSLAATADGILYAKLAADNTELAIIDARDPQAIRIAGRLKNETYESEFRGAVAIIGKTLLAAEYNAGAAAYDIDDPLAPKLKYRYQEVGPMTAKIQRRSANALPGSVTGIAGGAKAAFILHGLQVDSVAITPSGMEKLTRISLSKKSGSGLLSPTRVVLYRETLAIPTTMEGMRFYNVADPAKPQLLLNIDLPSRHEAIAKVGPMLYVTTDIDGVWQLDWEAEGGPAMSRRIPLKGLSEDLVLYKSHLYVANGQGLGVIDIADPQNPHEVHYWDFPYTDKPSMKEGWVEGVDQADGILYAACGFGGFAVFSLAEPSRPELLTIVKPQPPNEKKKKKYRMFGHDVSVFPSRNLLSFGGTDALALFDISDPANPKQLSCVNVASPTNNGSFSPDGRYMIGCGSGKFQVFDIADPTAPKALAEYPCGGSESALFYKGHILVPGRGNGINVFKIGQSPADLTLVQNIPAYFYNSKFWVEGDSVFTNCQGVHELRFATPGGAPKDVSTRKRGPEANTPR